ncbi:hypothetical protein [Lapillicoccus sp.]|uniref:hypothetical protein n=1 Tax=Lapillicoccus sp. TaxID=1909287 RepID=UPI0032675370
MIGLLLGLGVLVVLVGLIVLVVAVVARDVVLDAELEPVGVGGGVEAVQPATDRTSAAPAIGDARRAAPHRLRDLTNLTPRG